MYKVDVRHALDLLMPRWNTANSWNPQGKMGMHNLPRLAPSIDKVLRKAVAKYDRACRQSGVEVVDVSGDNVWTIQRTLRVSTLMHLFQKDFSWQKWRAGRLPILVRWRGKLVVWNGTHRTVLAKLAGKKLRAKIIDLDAFWEWSKTATPDQRRGIKRVLVFGDKRKKRPRRGNRK